jgi:hypothetical protein
MCPNCARTTGGVGTWFVEKIRDDGLYSGKCPNGHDLLLATQTLRHEMLFEIGLNATRDGYYREAVLSFAASTERYFEFAVRVITRGCGVSEEPFKKTWKSVANQSERQLGAYLFLYLAEFGTEPVLPKRRIVEIRNGVAHKGIIPERGEAVAFAEETYELIQSGIRQLREKRLDSVNAILGEETADRAKKMGGRFPRCFQVTPTALNAIADTSTGHPPFSRIVAEYGL